MRFNVWRGGLGRVGPGGEGEGALYSEFQCIMGNSHIGTPPPVDRQRHTSENITFPQLHWRAGTNYELSVGVVRTVSVILKVWSKALS